MMNRETSTPPTPAGAIGELFLISALILFLELACIRWFPAHVLFLTFFTNTVLLACFLGMSVGCLAANRSRSYLDWTPVLLAVATASAHLVEFVRGRSGSIVDVGNQASPQLVFFGVEYQHRDPAGFVLPIELLAGFFFLMIALAFIGPGQQLGRCLGRVPDRIRAYSVNIVGSITGIVFFAICSRYELPPIWWFTPVLAILTYFLRPFRWRRGLVLSLASLALIGSVAKTYVTGGLSSSTHQEQWSPYYRVDYWPVSKIISVNLIGHQQMISREAPSPAYALPYLLNRDAGGKPFRDVLIIGAGSGNDVSRALAWGAEQVDAVEIDPAIYRLGLRFHPDRPYLDQRVVMHLDDGRNFLRATDRKYDLIVYALVDSLVLHSSYSNIRLESYLFTTQAFRDARRHLRPGGVFVMYNYFRHGWLVARLADELGQVFGSTNPLIFSLPSRAVIEPNQVLFGEFTLIFSGETMPLREAFGGGAEYWLQANRAVDARTPNGFHTPSAAERAAWHALTAREKESSGWQQVRPAGLVRPEPALRLATDNWPFLYLNRPMLPALSLRGMATMAGIAIVLILPFARKGKGQRGAPPSGGGSELRMFFLGAGFMLLETKAVVQMALLFGGTWVVNSVVFLAVLLMILGANLFVARVRPRSLRGYYLALTASLALSAVVPPDTFLGMTRLVQVLASCSITFVPILFAGIIFAVSFDRTSKPERAFGANIAGAMVGGLAEYTSMLVGFQYLVLFAVLFYIISGLGKIGDTVGTVTASRLSSSGSPLE